MPCITANEFQRLVKSGHLKPKKNGLSFNLVGKGAAIGHLLEQHQGKEGKSLKKPKKKREEAKQLSQMKMYLKALGVEFVEEHYFAKPRKFRFDIAILSHMIAIEYEGINSEKSRHTSFVGYSTDCEKYNIALNRGWKVLRYTVANYESMITDVVELMKIVK